MTTTITASDRDPLIEHKRKEKFKTYGLREKGKIETLHAHQRERQFLLIVVHSHAVSVYFDVKFTKIRSRTLLAIERTDGTAKVLVTLPMAV